MSPGKVAAQAGHAYLGSAIAADPKLLAEYHKELPASPGTKVCLAAKDLDALIRARDLAVAAGIPHFLVVDSGCQNFFNGSPTITALGLGPVVRDQIQHITKKFQLL